MNLVDIKFNGETIDFKIIQNIGLDGSPGRHGTDGKDGINGKDGSNGKSKSFINFFLITIKLFF